MTATINGVGPVTESELDDENSLAVVKHRLTTLEHQVAKIDGKLDELLADKAKRDGAIAAGNWFTRAMWAVLGAFGMWFVEGQKP